MISRITSKKYSQTFLTGLVVLFATTTFTNTAYAQSFNCNNGKIIHTKSGKVLADAALSKKKEDLKGLRKRLIKKLKEVQKVKPIDYTITKKLKKKILATSKQIRELDNLIKNCKSEESALIYSETVKLDGYTLTTYHHRSSVKGKKIGVSAYLINDKGNVVTKHFGSVTGIETSGIELADTKGPAYFWDEEPSTICTNTFCSDEQEVIPVSLADNGKILFELRDGSISQTSNAPSNKFYIRDMNSNGANADHLKLQDDGLSESIFPQSIDKFDIIYGSSGTGAIPRWDGLTGKRIANLELGNQIESALRPEESRILDPETGDQLCSKIAGRKVTISELKVNKFGKLLGTFEYIVSCDLDLPSSIIQMPDIEMTYFKGAFISDKNGILTIPGYLMTRLDDAPKTRPFMLIPIDISNNGIGLLTGIFYTQTGEPFYSSVVHEPSGIISEKTFDYLGIDPSLLADDTETVSKVPSALNDAGDIVGTRPLMYKTQNPSNKISEAFAKIAERDINLNVLMPKNLGYIVLSATDINNCGEIVGGLKDTKSNEYLGFRISPDKCH